MKGRILIADDDLLFLSSIERALVEAGYAVSAVPDVERAKAMLTEQVYDVFVADIHMPGNEHLELLKAPELLKREVATILITGRASLETAIGAVEARVSAYLRKPFKPTALFEAIDAAMTQVRQRRLLTKLRTQNQQITELLETLDAGPTPTRQPLARLTERERASLSSREFEVLELIAAGLDTPSIARRLYISPFTVRNHMKAIYKKLGVNSHASLLYRLLAGSYLSAAP